MLGYKTPHNLSIISTQDTCANNKSPTGTTEKEGFRPSKQTNRDPQGLLKKTGKEIDGVLSQYTYATPITVDKVLVKQYYMEIILSQKRIRRSCTLI